MTNILVLTLLGDNGDLDGAENPGGGTASGEGAPSGDDGLASGSPVLTLLGHGQTLDLVVELKGGGQLEDADVVLVGEASVVLVDDDLGDVDGLLVALLGVEGVLTGNDLNVAGVLAATAVGGGQDVVGVNDGAAAEVEGVAAEEGLVLEGHLVGDGVGGDLLAADDLGVVLHDGEAELGLDPEALGHVGDPDLGLGGQGEGGHDSDEAKHGAGDSIGCVGCKDCCFSMFDFICSSYLISCDVRMT